MLLASRSGLGHPIFGELYPQRRCCSSSKIDRRLGFHGYSDRKPGIGASFLHLSSAMLFQSRVGFGVRGCLPIQIHATRRPIKEGWTFALEKGVAQDTKAFSITHGTDHMQRELLCWIGATDMGKRLNT